MNNTKQNQLSVDDIIGEAIEAVIAERKASGVVQKANATHLGRASFAKEVEDYIEKRGLTRDLAVAALRERLQREIKDLEKSVMLNK